MALILMALIGPADGLAAETLQDAWRLALEADRTLQAAENRVESASAEHDAARGGRLPTFAVAAGVTRWGDTPAFDFTAAGLPGELPLFGGRSMRTTDARVSLPLYSGGRISASIDAAGATLASRRRASDTAVQDVRAATAQSYVDVLRAESAVAIADARTASLAAHTSDVESMFENGQVPRNDLLAASVSLADAEQQQLKARNALEIARAGYNRRLGRPLGEPVNLDPALPPPDPRVASAALDGIFALAIEKRAELAALASAQEALRASSAAARADGLPQLAISGAWTELENDFLNREDFWTIGVTLQWNVLDGGSSRHRAAALSAQAEAISREREELRSLIELAVRQAWLDVQESRQRVIVADAAIEQAEENLRVVRDRYLQGEGTNTEVLDAEALLATSRGNHESARFDAALAGYRLARAAGVL
jgi:outer membrane protein